jgi:hypothetical protein
MHGLLEQCLLLAIELIVPALPGGGLGHARRKLLSRRSNSNLIDHVIFFAVSPCARPGPWLVFTTPGWRAVICARNRLPARLCAAD